MRTRILAAMSAVLLLLLWALVSRDRGREAAQSPAAPIESPVAEDSPKVLASAEPLREPAPPILEEARANGSPAISASPEPVAEVASAGTLLHGHVRPAVEGEGFASSPTATLTDVHGQRQRLECSPAGAFAIATVMPGVYWLSASGPDGGRGSVEFELSEGLEQLEVDVRLERGWEVQVSLRSERGGAPNWLMPLAVATLEPLGEWFDEPRGAISNPYGVGRFLPGQPDGVRPGSELLGTLRIDVDAPVWVQLVRHHRVLARQRISPGQRTVDFVVDASVDLAMDGSLRARLVADDTGQPIARANLEIESQASSMTRTDADGRFFARRLAPGFCRIKLRAAGHAWDELVRIEPGTELDLGEVRVPAELSIRGHLVGGAVGVELPRIRHERLDERTGEPIWNGSLQLAQADADGLFAIRGLLPGTYALSIEGDGTPWRRRTVRLRDRPVEDIEIELEATTPLCVVVGRGVRPDGMLELISPAGERIATLPPRPGTPRSFHLPPGRYTLRHGDEERSVEVGQAPAVLRLP